MNKILRVSPFSVLYIQVVVFEFHSFVVVPEVVGALPVEPHDVFMDYVITNG